MEVMVVVALHMIWKIVMYCPKSGLSGSIAWYLVGKGTPQHNYCICKLFELILRAPPSKYQFSVPARITIPENKPYLFSKT